eukprot:CAMPEP_0181238042 /NCGR_PEP_ID=MMETSP1096-20121128/39111_1 /TAXON_ID=156174 ORGANISM="Chrysochromulina ericina, Strain CCMP281" /NCGR_SAMPLE_ID=MMETSP1096 /ASSEMBLY_ACC=CAM_ASM_000453 /LENGTH=108 /DNA_ID=CAMNT_0023333489 /DNA_START=1 /DNA_END=323 /DNA_ORIENTATION=-
MRLRRGVDVEAQAVRSHRPESTTTLMLTKFGKIAWEWEESGEGSLVLRGDNLERAQTREVKRLEGMLTSVEAAPDGRLKLLLQLPKPAPGVAPDADSSSANGVRGRGG